MRRIVLFVTVALLAAGCINSQKKGGQTSKAQVETPTRGTATLMVDETLISLIKSEVNVFEYDYKYAHVNIVALADRDISRLLLSDSLRLAVIARELTSEELAWFESKTLTPRTTPIAYDGVALVVNSQNDMDSISMDELRVQLRGTASNAMTMVFDNPASSTVSYMKKIAGSDSLPRAFSMNSNSEILEYIASHPGAIGFTGVDWLYEADSLHRKYVDKIKVIAVGDKTTGYYKPTQNDIAGGYYPLTRTIYIVNAQGSSGLGVGLASFMAGDVGQRIVLKSGLVPVTFPKREINIRKKL